MRENGGFVVVVLLELHMSVQRMILLGCSASSCDGGSGRCNGKNEIAVVKRAWGVWPGSLLLVNSRRDLNLSRVQNGTGRTQRFLCGLSPEWATPSACGVLRSSAPSTNLNQTCNVTGLECNDGGGKNCKGRTGSGFVP